jgi:hypothetical protein
MRLPNLVQTHSQVENPLAFSSFVRGKTRS